MIPQSLQRRLARVEAQLEPAAGYPLIIVDFDPGAPLPPEPPLHRGAGSLTINAYRDEPLEDVLQRVPFKVGYVVRIPAKRSQQSRPEAPSPK